MSNKFQFLVAVATKNRTMYFVMDQHQFLMDGKIN